MTTRWAQLPEKHTVPCRHLDNGFVVKDVDGASRSEKCDECDGTRRKPVVKECNG